VCLSVIHGGSFRNDVTVLCDLSVQMTWLNDTSCVEPTGNLYMATAHSISNHSYTVCTQVYERTGMTNHLQQKWIDRSEQLMWTFVKFSLFRPVQNDDDDERC